MRWITSIILNRCEQTRIVSFGAGKVQDAYLIALLSSGAHQIRQTRRIGHVMRLIIRLTTSHTSPVERCRSPTTGSCVRKRCCAKEGPWFAIMSSAKYDVLRGKMSPGLT